MSPVQQQTAADLLAAVERDGFVVVPDVIPSDRFAELDELRAGITTAYDRLVESGELFHGGGTISGHLNCIPGSTSKFVYDAIREKGLLDVVRAHDPDAVDWIRVTMNFNLPHSHDQHFHSDGLFVEKFVITGRAKPVTSQRRRASSFVVAQSSNVRGWLSRAGRAARSWPRGRVRPRSPRPAYPRAPRWPARSAGR